MATGQTRFTLKEVSQGLWLFVLTSGKLRRRQFYSQPLENGRLLTQGSTFTYQDVLDRLLVYTPETVSGGADEVAFTLTDGTFTYTGRLEFTMDVTRSEGPRMTVNRGLQLPAGEEAGEGWWRGLGEAEVDEGCESSQAPPQRSQSRI